MADVSTILPDRQSNSSYAFLGTGVYWRVPLGADKHG